LWKDTCEGVSSRSTAFRFAFGFSLQVDIGKRERVQVGSSEMRQPVLRL
jgi:hypothetical protein